MIRGLRTYKRRTLLCMAVRGRSMGARWRHSAPQLLAAVQYARAQAERASEFLTSTRQRPPTAARQLSLFEHHRGPCFDSPCAPSFMQPECDARRSQLDLECT